MEMYLLLIAAVVISYLVGSFNAAINISRHYTKKDIRKYGSGNAGTTNMLRTFGPVLGTMTFLMDIGKGALAVFIGMLPGILFNDPSFKLIGGMIGGIFAVIGHNWPIYYGFKGGKGIACTIGLFLMFDPLFTLLLFAIAMISVILFKYVSVASLIGTFIFWAYLSVVNLGKPLFWYYCVGFLIVWVLAMNSHKANIARLREGTEKKIDIIKIYSEKRNKRLNKV